MSFKASWAVVVLLCVFVSSGNAFGANALDSGGGGGSSEGSGPSQGTVVPANPEKIPEPSGAGEKKVRKIGNKLREKVQNVIEKLRQKLRRDSNEPGSGLQSEPLPPIEELDGFGGASSSRQQDQTNPSDNPSTPPPSPENSSGSSSDHSEDTIDEETQESEVDQTGDAGPEQNNEGAQGQTGDTGNDQAGDTGRDRTGDREEEPVANDGSTFSQQPRSVQDSFRRSWGDRAAAQWVDEHNINLGRREANGEDPQPEGARIEDATAESVLGQKMGNGTAEGAVAWALDQLPGGSQNGFNRNNGQATKDDETTWDYYCLAFCATAWGRVPEELAAVGAIDAYNKLKASGKIETEGNPPAGAVLFQDVTASNTYGHIVLATGELDPDGDPYIITVGWKNFRGVHKITLGEMRKAYKGAYLGWALP